MTNATAPMPPSIVLKKKTEYEIRQHFINVREKFNLIQRQLMCYLKKNPSKK